MCRHRILPDPSGAGYALNSVLVESINHLFFREDLCMLFSLDFLGGWTECWLFHTQV